MPSSFLVVQIKRELTPEKKALRLHNNIGRPDARLKQVNKIV